MPVQNTALAAVKSHNVYFNPLHTSPRLSLTFIPSVLSLSYSSFNPSQVLQNTRYFQNLLLQTLVVKLPSVSVMFAQRRPKINA